MLRSCTVLVALIFAQTALAIDYTYTAGASATATWSNPASWGGVGYPNSFSDTAYFDGTSGQWVKTDGGPFQVGNITLGNGLGRTTAITIGFVKNTLGLEIGGSATITKHDATTDRFYCGLQLDGATTFNVTAGQLTTFGLIGSGGVVKNGSGNLMFDAFANSFAGQTLVNAGGLYLNGTAGLQEIGSGGLKMTGGQLTYSTIGGGNHIADIAPIDLGGGAAIVPNGNAETVGALTLSGDATCYGLAAGDAGFHFANSSTAAWAPSAMLTLTTTGSAVSPKYYFGSNNTGLTVGQLAQIRFLNGSTGEAYSAGFDASNTGLLVPVVHTFWAADFNHDLIVNYRDYLVLENNFGKSGMSNAQGDADNDGLVNYRDYILLEGQFGKTSTPEPTTIALLIAGGMAMLRRKA